MHGSVARPAALAALVGALIFVSLPQAAGAVTRAQAEAKALQALEVRDGTRPVIVFRLAGSLAPGAVIAQSGTARPAVAGRQRVRNSRQRVRNAAGVALVRVPVVARVAGERAWFFYEDQGPYQAYQHAGRVVLVGVRSGRVRVSRPLRWPPLVNGRLPAFLASTDGYLDSRRRVFAREWSLPASARATRARARAAAKAADAATVRKAHDALVAERSCFVRVSDTVGALYDSGPVESAEVGLDEFFAGIGLVNSPAQYRYSIFSGTTPTGYVQRTIASGCRDVFLYLAGGGFARGGSPAVNVGNRALPGRLSEQQNVTARDLRALIARNRGVTFKLMVDAPYSGGFVAALGRLRNLLIVKTASGPGQAAFDYLPSAQGPGGQTIANSGNSNRRLEFTNRQLTGLHRFLADPREVDAAAAAVALGRAPSFMAWMLARAFALGADQNLSEHAAGTDPAIVTPTFDPPGPDGPGPGAVNRAPTAADQAVTAVEDTAQGIVLSGSDPDGDALTFTVTGAPAHGTLTGNGPNLTYTPDPDFDGTDSFAFRTSDGSASSAPATVSITVSAVNDAPRVDLNGAGGGIDATASFVEDQPAIAPAPAATVTDPDDANLQSGSVTLTNRPDGANEAISLDTSGTSIVAGAYNPATGTISLTGPDTVANYQQVLRSVRYENTSQTPDETARAIDFQVSDGSLESTVARATVGVTDANELPVLDLNGPGVGNDSTATHDEDGAAVSLTGPATVSDADDTDLESATLVLSPRPDGAAETLSVDTTGTSIVAGTYNTATGVLTLTGTDTLANYAQVIQSAKYANSDQDPDTGPRSVAFTVNDGEDGSAVRTSTVTVTASNDVPSIDLNGAAAGIDSAASFTEDAGAALLAPAAVASDPDDANLDSATIELTSRPDGGAESLSVTVPAGNPVAASAYDAGTGVLTLTGPATKAQFEAVIRSLRYDNASDTPDTTARTVDVEVSDGALDSPVAHSTVSVAASNDTPRLDLNGPGAGIDTTPSFTEDAGAASLAPAAAASDPDDADLASAELKLVNRPDGSAESLAVSVPAGNPVASTGYDDSTGTLTLTGPATKAQFEAVLQSARYDNSSNTPDTSPRVIEAKVNDGDADSPVAKATVSVTAANDAPTVDLNGAAAGTGSSATFSEPVTPPTSPAQLAPSATIDDPDDTNLESATITLTNRPDGAFESLSVTVPPGNPVTAGSYDDSTGVLTLTGPATKAQFEAVIRSLRYDNTKAPPDGADRLVEVTVHDGGASSVAQTATVHVVPQNDPPVLDLNGAGAGEDSTATFTEGGSPVTLAGAATITDTNDTHMESAKVTLTSRPDGAAESLNVTIPGGSGISTTGYDSSTGVLALTGPGTLADYQTALRSVTYANADEDPDTSSTRSVTFKVNDGQANSSTRTSVVTVGAVNDAPTLDLDDTAAGHDAAATFTEDGAAAALAPNAAPSDVDDTHLESATITLTNRPDGVAESLTVDTSGTTVGVGAYDTATGVLTLTGSHSVADYKTVLRTLKYANSDQDPDTAARSVTFKVSDGAAESTPLRTTTVTVNAVNDEPAVTPSPSKMTNYVEQDNATDPANAARALDPLMGVDDVDSANLSEAKVKITTGLNSAQDVLAFTDPNPGSGLSGAYVAATGTLTLSGSDTKAHYLAALQSVTYRNTSHTPDTATRTIQITATDAAAAPLTSDVATWDFTVTAVNDAPTDSGEAQDATGNTRLEVEVTSGGTDNPRRTSATGNLLDNSADADDPSGLVVSGEDTTDPAHGSVVVSSSGSYVYTPDAGYTGADSFQYRVEDDEGAESSLSTVSITVASRVWFVRADAPAGGDGRSDTPFNTLDAGDVAATAASDRIYAFRKSGDSGTVSDASVDLLSGQQLLGSAIDLVVDAKTLYDGTAALRPQATLTSVKLDDANTVSGLAIGGPAIAPAIEGASGDVDGTIADNTLSGAGGGLVLSAATGTWNLSDLTVSTTGGDAISATGAGARTVNFTPAGTISISHAGGRALALTGAATSGTVDSVTLTSSPTSGVSLSDNTGSLTLNGVALTATGTALSVNSANDVTINGSNVTSSAGTAVDLRTDGANPANPPDVTLTSTTSNGGAAGINIDDIGAGTFSGGTGSLQGATGPLVDVNAGSGNVTYAGTLNNGAGLSAQVTGRTGGAVSLSGSINDTNDAGGGIDVSGNSGGSSTFSGTTKTLNTGAGAGVSFTGSPGHTLTVSGGGLDVDTTSGRGIDASASGTIAVSGSGNTVLTDTGRGVSVENTSIGAGDLTLQSVNVNSDNAGAGPDNGIRLESTGTAGNLAVIGTSSTCARSNPISACNGGSIINTTADGVRLTSTAGTVLQRMNISGSDGTGIHAPSGSSDLTFTNLNLAGNGDAFGAAGTPDAGIAMGTVTGTNAINGGTFVTNSHNNQIEWQPSSGTGTLNVTSTSVLDAGQGPSTGANGISVVASGTATAHLNVGAGGGGAADVAIDNNPADGLLTSATDTSTITSDVDNVDFSRGNRAISHAGRGTTVFRINNSDFNGFNPPTDIGSAGSTISINPIESGQVDGTITNNRVGTAGQNGSGAGRNFGIVLGIEDGSDADLNISNNSVRETAQEGIFLYARDFQSAPGSVANVNLTLRDNVVADIENLPAPDTFTNLNGIEVEAQHDSSMCADIANNDSASVGTSTTTGTELRTRQLGTSTFRLEGLTANSDAEATVETFLNTRNPLIPVTEIDAQLTTQYTAEPGNCPMPALP